ncbi:MAG TPA: hypothetical protein VHZ25_00990 [Acidobacteriaceae bacterium]|nr:hypothetical protein [Acidobacteriaceae bacterium]
MPASFTKIGTKTTRMRKSQAISFTLLAAAAVSFSTGCERHPPTQIRNCVDDQRIIVSDDACDNAPFTGSAILPGTYHYLYGGASGGHYGDKVVGGSWRPAVGARIVSGDTGAVVHGGFGGYPGTEGIGA